MHIVRSVWRVVRWPIGAIVLILAALFIYELARYPQKSRDTVAAIHSQKLTLADVDGSNLPPIPDPRLVDATIEGIDANSNGIRDDVERAIYNYSKENPKLRAAMMQYALALQSYLTNVLNTETWVAVNEEKALAYNCIFSSLNGTSLDISRTTSFVDEKQFNTAARKQRKIRSNTYATSFSAPKGAGCDLKI